MEQKNKGIGIQIISPIEAKAHVAAVTDGKRSMVSMDGAGDDILPLTTAIMMSAIQPVVESCDTDEEIMLAAGKVLSRLASIAVSTAIEQKHEKEGEEE